MTQNKQAPPMTAAAIPEAVWAPVVSGLLMLLAGALGIAFHQVWLFPSLGPTAYLQTESPDQKTAHFYNTTVGHLIGLLAGLGAVWVFASGDPPVFVAHSLSWGRVIASVVAVAITSLGGLLLKAQHPPAAATTLLIALGGFRPTLHDMLALVVGVLIVATVGELFRRWRGGEPLAPGVQVQ